MNQTKQGKWQHAERGTRNKTTFNTQLALLTTQKPKKNRPAVVLKICFMRCPSSAVITNRQPPPVRHQWFLVRARHPLTTRRLQPLNRQQSRVAATPKLQALVYDILLSTTAVFSYAIGSKKLSKHKRKHETHPYPPRVKIKNKRVPSRFKRLWFYLCWCKLCWRL